MTMNHLLYTMFSLALTLLASCSLKNKEQQDIVTEWVGKELIIPDNLQVQVGDTPIDYDFDDADFKIVTYIDSSDCTGCRMMLPLWNKFINELKAREDVNLNF